jgi:O-antigen/teichoic acid export membrane protein
VNIPPSRRPVSLRRNFIWTAWGQAFYGLMQWGMVVVYAKLGDPTTVGTFTLATAIVTPIVLFTNMQLRAVLASDAKNDFSFSDYASLRIMGSAVAFIFALLLALLMGYSPYVVTVIVIVAGAKCVESASDIIYGLLQKSERFDKVAISLSIRSFAGLGGVVVVMFATRSLLYATLAVALLWAVALLKYDVEAAGNVLREDVSMRNHVAPQARLASHYARLKSLAILALPMGLVTMLISLNLNIPRLVIEQKLGLRQLGYFGVLLYPVMTGNIAVFALGESTVPRLSREFVHNLKGFVRTWMFLAVIAAGIGSIAMVVVSVWGEDLLRILYGASYQRYSQAFAWLMLGTSLGWIGSANGYALTAARNFKIQVPLFLITVAITLGGCLALVSRNRLVGAGQAITLSGIAYIVLAGGAVALSTIRRHRSLNQIQGLTKAVKHRGGID